MLGPPFVLSLKSVVPFIHVMLLFLMYFMLQQAHEEEICGITGNVRVEDFARMKR